MPTAPIIRIEILGSLRPLLRPRWRRARSIIYPLTRPASIKDIIEALGIPHTEVEEITNGRGHLDFSHLPVPGEHLRVLPPRPPRDPCRATLLRPEPLVHIRFLVDGNMAKLTRLLRLTGLDAREAPGATPEELAVQAGEQGRILLSRNRDLLKRKTVGHGSLIRARDPEDQLAEVIRLYGLGERLRPWSRCMACNTLLVPVAKKEILHRLQPLTRHYYDRFNLCSGCGRIYWPGSHVRRMNDLLRRLKKRLSAPSSDPPAP